MIFANGDSGTLLDANLNTLQIVKVNIFYCIYSHLLKQLKLPQFTWNYSETNSQEIHVAIPDGLIFLDEVWIKSIDKKLMLTPHRLYAYYLLEQFLGLNEGFKGIVLVSQKKYDFLILNDGRSFDLTREFNKNELLNWLFKNFRKEDFQEIHDAFFVLLNPNFKEKLMLALTQHQNKTGFVYDKQKWVEDILNVNRLDKLSNFSKNILGKL